MRIRKRIFPRTLVDSGAFLFVTFIIPVVYWFELYVVLPSLHSPWTCEYTVHFILANFFMVNITSSFVGMVVIDTSCKGNPTRVSNINWHLCKLCEEKVPPRSWHCKICQTCILKRDHHCLFAGCCIGHHNHRCFLMFLFYLCVSTVYATYYNYIFLSKSMNFSKMVLRTVFSVMLFVTRAEIDTIQLYLTVSHIIIGGLILSAILLYYHGRLLLFGVVGYERKHYIVKYNEGIKQNFKNVFGNRWYISWLSPFISSELPYNGFDWDLNQVQINLHKH